MKKPACAECQDKGPHWFLATVSYGQWVIVDGPFHSPESAADARGEQNLTILNEHYRETGL